MSRIAYDGFQLLRWSPPISGRKVLLHHDGKISRVFSVFLRWLTKRRVTYYDDRQKEERREKKGKEPIVERGEKGSFSNDEFLFPHPYFSSTSFSSVFLLSWHSASRRTLTRYEHSNWPVKSLNWHSSFPFTHRLWRQPAIFLNSSRIVMKSSAFVHMTVWRREEEAAKEEGYTGGEHSDDF